MTPTTDNTLKGIAYGLATTLVGSSAAAAGKWVAVDVPVPTIVFMQYAICLLVMIPWFAKQPISSLHTKRFNTHLVRGFGGWLCFYSYYAALKQIPLVDATLLRNTAPLFVPIIALFWLAEKVTLLRWTPIILGFIGIIFILRPEGSGIGWGHLIGLASGFTLAISMVGTRTLSKTDSGKTIMFYYFAISFILSTPLAIYHWQPIPLRAWPYLIFIGFSIFITMWLYTKAFSYAKASVVSPINYFSVVISGFLGWLIWSDIPTHTALIGAIFVIAAAILSFVISNKEDAKPSIAN